MKNDPTLNSGTPDWQGLDDHGKEEITRRLNRSGKARLRGGMRTLQNLEDGVTDAAEQQEHVEAAKVADHEAGEEAHAQAQK